MDYAALMSTSPTALELREREQADLAECEAILRSLPDWFGIEESIQDYVADLQRMQTTVAVTGGAIVGFLTVNRRFKESAEIQVMGVQPGSHHLGIGRRLVERVEAQLREDGCEYLQVKTLSPGRPDVNYAKTRMFYEALDFRPLEEMKTLWSPGNPCLIYIKRL